MKLRTIARALLAGAALSVFGAISACGGGGGGGVAPPPPPAASTCVLDTGKLDTCTLG